jgi:hypothetical protein
MIGRFAHQTAAAAVVFVALGLTACAGRTSPVPPVAQGPQFASVEQVPLLPAASCAIAACMYVTNVGTNSVTVYPERSNGNVAPVATISGSNTSMNHPEGVAVDAGHNIYVANAQGGHFGLGSVAVFAAGATGNVAPIATITGSTTMLNYPEGVALDAGSNLYPPGANGDVAPIRTIAGPHTGLYGPVGIALDQAGAIYVSNYDSSSLPSPGSVTVYAAGANGDAKPTAIIKGSSTGLFGTLGIALDARRNIYVANQARPGTFRRSGPSAAR